MRQGGRGGGGEVEPDGAYPDPPARLSEAAAEVWQAAVHAMPAGHFTRETWELLEMYCFHFIAWKRHTTEYERLFEVDADGVEVVVDHKWLNQLSIMRERERRNVADLATKLRLTPQATQDPKKRGNRGTGGKKPHEV